MISFQAHSRLVVGLFWAVAAGFILALICWAGAWGHLLPTFMWRPGRVLFPWTLLLILVLGILQLVLLVRRRTEWTNIQLKRGLLLTGASATATGAGVILHNLLDGLAKLTAGWHVVSSVLQALAVVFFFVGLVAPLFFLLALVGTAGLILLRKTTEA